MSREDYLRLAGEGLRMPIGADLVLRQHADGEAIMLDGARLGAIVAEAARGFRTPIALPLMDLTVEKAGLLQGLGVPAEQMDSCHFERCPEDAAAGRAVSSFESAPHPRVKAGLEAIRFVAAQGDLIPIGMAIGPFSLTTKLIADPITPVFLAGTGVTGGEDEEVLRLERVVELATRITIKSVEMQIAAGAKAIEICEPAANKVYFSPNQLAAGADIFERFVMAPNRRVAASIAGGGADLVFHCCGELIDPMVRAFGTLRPVLLSLGSSRTLWNDARLVPEDVVLYGNLPSKRFYSAELGAEQVRRLAAELREKMRAAGHPFILGTECDVLSVPGSEEAIWSKVRAMMDG